jgi:hypothetical protein
MEEKDWLFDEKGDDITGHEFIVGEDDSSREFFDPAKHSGWHMVMVKEIEADPYYHFGENSKNRGQKAPKWNIKWEIISPSRIGLAGSPHAEKTIPKDDPIDGVEINFDGYYFHPSTQYQINELAKALRLPYTEHPTEKNKQTGEPLKLFRFNENEIRYAVCVAMIVEQTKMDGTPTGYPCIGRASGRPIIQPVYPDGVWKMIKGSDLPF